LRYGSVCSGIEAATAAWHVFGWEPVFFSEIESFPRDVLAYHYPEVELYGDFTKIDARVAPGIDLLVGGTPCQSFSVSGLRKGMDDPRGNLALGYLRLVDRMRPRWVVWENVPGVLSSANGRDFGAFLGALGELGYGWAYRILDAQYCGVPQRRRRVFVVGYLGDWRPPVSVLFESESMRRNPPPSRTTREGSARGAQGGAPAGRGPAARGQGQGGTQEAPAGQAGQAEGQVVPIHLGGDQKNSEVGIDQAATLNCDKGQRGGILALGRQEPIHMGADHSKATVKEGVANTLRASCGVPGGILATPEGVDAFNGEVTGDVAQTVCAKDGGTNFSIPHALDDPRGVDVVNGAEGQDVAHTISARDNEQAIPHVLDKHRGVDMYNQEDTGDVAHTVRAMTGGEGIPHVVDEPKSVSENICGDVNLNDQTNSLTAGGGKPGQGYPCVLEPPINVDAECNANDNIAGALCSSQPANVFDPGEETKAISIRTNQTGANGRPDLEEKVGSLEASGVPPAVAFTPAQASGRLGGDPTEVAPTLKANAKGGDTVPHVAFQPGNLRRRAGSDPSADVFPTLKCGEGDQMPHVAVGFYNNQGGQDKVTDDGQSPPVKAGSGPGGSITPAVAFTASDMSNKAAWERDQNPTLTAQVPNDTSNIQHGIREGMQVRRLTPKECERLQGFPDDYTLIPRKGKTAEQCPDGPRYKALGNSMAVPVMRWIGARIEEVDKRLNPPKRKRKAKKKAKKKGKTRGTRAKRR